MPIRGFFILVLIILFSKPAMAQLVVNFTPRISFFPTEILKVKRTEQGQTDVNDDVNFDIGDSSVEISDFRGGLNLGIIMASTATRTVSYSGFDSTGDNISESANYNISKDDLPNKLYKDYLQFGFPLFIGDQQINLFYGEMVVSDRKDITDEDRIKVGFFELILTPQEDESWVLGWYYADAFGGVYNVPVVGFVSRTNEDFDVQVVFPVKWSIDIAFDSGWVFGAAQQVEGDAYKLTSSGPWDSAIVAFSDIKSVAKIGYHLGGLYFSFEGGLISQQKIRFYDESISISSEEISEDNYLSGDVPFLEISVADTSFFSAGLSLAF